MLLYEEFLKIMRGLGLSPSDYLPDVFNEIIDEFEYPIDKVIKMIGKSEPTVRRWCNQGLLKYQQKHPYIIKGIDLKDKPFKDYYPSIAKQLCMLEHLEHPLLNYVIKKEKRKMKRKKRKKNNQNKQSQ